MPGLRQGRALGTVRTPHLLESTRLDGDLVDICAPYALLRLRDHQSDRDMASRRPSATGTTTTNTEVRQTRHDRATRTDQCRASTAQEGGIVAQRELDGTRMPESLFEAAARHYSVIVRCKCGRESVFHGAALWWKFERKGWNNHQHN